MASMMVDVLTKIIWSCYPAILNLPTNLLHFASCDMLGSAQCQYLLRWSVRCKLWPLRVSKATKLMFEFSSKLVDPNSCLKKHKDHAKPNRLTLVVEWQWPINPYLFCADPPLTSGHLLVCIVRLLLPFCLTALCYCCTFCLFKNGRHPCNDLYVLNSIPVYEIIREIRIIKMYTQFWRINYKLKNIKHNALFA